jgi:hypothetical protein
MVMALNIRRLSVIFILAAMVTWYFKKRFFFQSH